MNISRAGLPALLLLPGALVVALAFSAGGYFPGPPALAAVVLALLLVGRLMLAADPVAGIGPLLLSALTALALLAGWTLLSSTWSDAPARALVEYDRVLLYLLAAVLFGSLGRSAHHVRWLVRGVLLALFAVCLAGFLTRTLPDVFATSSEIEPERLSYPLSYWNGMGIMASLGLILGLGTSSDQREHPVVRVLAAAALPVFSATLLFTLSRGALAAGGVGLLAAALTGRSRLLLSGLIASVPAAVAAAAGYGAELLTSPAPTTAAATAQGHDVAAVTALCVLTAGAMRGVLLLLDRRAVKLEVPAPLRRPAVRVLAAVLLCAVVGVGALAAGAPQKIDRQYDRFVNGDALETTRESRERLTDPGNNGRLNQWRVAIDGSRSDRLHGTGAGTYALLWDRDRPERYQVEDAHSLYIEMLSDLGLVGLFLLLVAIGLILGGFALRARGPDRVVYGSLFGAGLAWSLHAGIDWLWELPATGIWLFAAGGLALARPSTAGTARSAVGRLPRIIAALFVLLVAVIPARVFLSELPLRDAVQAFARGDCRRAVDRSLDSIAMLPQRPEPFQIVGYCDVRLGYPELAVQALENATRLDPSNWEFRYGLALVQGATGLDPRREAAEAHRLNPLSELAEDLARDFAGGDPQEWRRRALSARLPGDD